MPADAYGHTREALAQLGGQRVWSLLVTVFGDLAARRDATIAGPAVSRIMSAFDIRPEATRVALHRLRNDGWLISQKAGRHSLHRLTDQGLSETLVASRRIYAAPGKDPAGWQLAMTHPAAPDPRDRMEKAGFVALGNRLYAGPSNGILPAETLCLQGGAVPDWLRAQLGALALPEDCAQLCIILAQADTSLPSPETLTPLQHAVLRCLIVHGWRRLVLKLPDLPDRLYPPDWRGAECRRLVHRLLVRFPRPDPAQL